MTALLLFLLSVAVPAQTVQESTGVITGASGRYERVEVLSEGKTFDVSPPANLGSFGFNEIGQVWTVRQQNGALTLVKRIGPDQVLRKRVERIRSWLQGYSVGQVKIASGINSPKPEPQQPFDNFLFRPKGDRLGVLYSREVVKKVARSHTTRGGTNGRGSFTVRWEEEQLIVKDWLLEASFAGETLVVERLERFESMKLAKEALDLWENRGQELMR